MEEPRTMEADESIKQSSRTSTYLYIKTSWGCQSFIHKTHNAVKLDRFLMSLRITSCRSMFTQVVLSKYAHWKRDLVQ